MLSDSCYEFLFAFDQAAKALTDATLWYTSPDSAVIYGKEVRPLRMALAKVRLNPDDNEARVALLRATASVMERLDGEPVFVQEKGSNKRRLLSGNVRRRSRSEQ